MKKSISYSIVLFAILTFCFSCNTPNPDPIDNNVKNATGTTPKDAISVETFNTWTKNWEENGKTFVAEQSAIIRYFDMPKVDLTEVLGEEPVGTRFYIGLDGENLPTSIHLIVVGTDANKQNMLDPSKGQYAYDVSNPCPPVCL